MFNRNASKLATIGFLNELISISLVLLISKLLNN